jgi:GNAT superfamily N-acetyltransferase
MSKGKRVGDEAKFRVRRVMTLDPAVVAGLCDVLVDCVEGGASVSFMQPMTRAKAEAFWNGLADDIERGGRLLYIAEDGLGICGTAQIVLAATENQPHRGDLAKMLVHRRARRRGVGEALMRAAAAGAKAAGRTLLVLDTADAGAERLYQRCGWVRVGAVPDYALLPSGGFCDTVFYYRRLD